MRFSSSIFLLLALVALAPQPSSAQQNPPATAPAGERFVLNIAEGTGAPVAEPDGTVQFIGTATVLIRYQGLTILTDPNFLHKGDHVHLGYGIHSQRQTNPAVELEQLPPIDLVLLSHFHEDHFDKKVQKQLARNTPIITTQESSEHLERLGFVKRFGLSRWDTVEVRKGATVLTVTAMPGRHGPAGITAVLPTVMGSMLEFAERPGKPRFRMYISGDTLVYDDIADIPKRYPDIDLALLHLGGTRILGVLKVTMDGEDGVRMLQLVAPRKAIPIHYNDYDVFKSPLSDFTAAAKKAGLEGKIVYLKHGDTYAFTQPAKP
ncbi:MAG: MBL fold metallo-hydrolase [Gammaproteobacteria bacterium]